MLLRSKPDFIQQCNARLDAHHQPLAQEVNIAQQDFIDFLSRPDGNGAHYSQAAPAHS